jgi:hypothetical protein
MTPTSPAIRRNLEPTHPCIRCGREGVPADAGLCELCNPLELSQPSATQMHGIAAVGILAFIAVIAVVARVLMVSIGPFDVGATQVQPAPGGLAVTFDVTNAGSNPSATTCQIRDVDPGFAAPRVEVVQTPRIGPGETITVNLVVTKFGTEGIGLVASCGSQ